MRVFLDTNVLASAAATRGLCADVLREVFACHELVVCAQVLDELDRILGAKFGIHHDLIDDFISLLQQDTILAAPGRTPDIKLRDKDDLCILAAAGVGKAEVFVTGDKELLSLGHVGSLKILSPRQFWEEVKTQQPRSERGRRRDSGD
jgi:putative PIN family toxin of toxin-antitoxin system